MPYEIREEGGRYCVYKKGGEKKKCYKDRGKAEDYMKALYAAEDDDSDDMDDDDKAVHESSLGDGDPETVVLDDTVTEPVAVVPPPPPLPEPPPDDDTHPYPVPARKNFLQRLVDRLLPQNTAFKMAGNHFLITWSNNFEDRDGELFSEKAIDDYVDRVDMGMVPPPELWVWHAGKGVRIGQAAMVGRHGHFVVALGEFDDSSTAQKAKAYYQKHQRETGVSHGFTYPATAFDGRVYHSFNTFEISLLPKAVAANPFTNLEQVKESMKMLNENKRKYLRDVFGEEADHVLETLEESGKALEDMQLVYKDFTSTRDPEPTEVSEQAVKEASSDLKDLIPDLIEGQAEVFKVNAAIMHAIKEARETIVALTARVEQAEKEARDATENMAALKADLPRRPSTDAETIIDEAKLPEAMKNSMKQLDESMSKLLGVPVTKVGN